MDAATAGALSRRRRFWRRLVIVLAILVAATAAVLAYLLFTEDEPTGEAAVTIAQVTELRSRSAEINGTWDEQESQISEDERSELYGETEAQLETLLADTRAFVDGLADASLPGADREAVDAAAAEMVKGAEWMLEGLRVPGRNNKELRLSGIEVYETACDEMISIVES